MISQRTFAQAIRNNPEAVNGLPAETQDALSNLIEGDYVSWEDAAQLGIAVLLLARDNRNLKKRIARPRCL